MSSEKQKKDTVISDTEMNDFKKFMEETTNAEAKKLDSMTEAEVRRYAASTQVHLTHAYGLIVFLADAVTTLQETQLLTIEAVNKVVGINNNIDENNIAGVNKTMEQIKAMAGKNVC